jgi:hypothetical protein
MKNTFLALLLALSGTAFAGEAPTQKPAQVSEIPTTEKEFVAVINSVDKDKIIQQFGEPSKKDDVTHHKTGKVIASIWHYHFINTDEKGEYYETTELDFVDDKVVMVVFMNNNGEDVTTGKTVEVPVKPEL